MLAPASLLIVALVADQTMQPLAREFMTPLDEGMVMDMPITVPRASVTESVDDLKARDMVLCRFPEVDMVVGKAGRAETPTDPAPMDMIETMVNFRPREFWPRRKLRACRRRRSRAAPSRRPGRTRRDRAAGRRRPRATRWSSSRSRPRLPLFDAASREYAYHRNQEMLRDTGGISPTSMNPIRARGSRGLSRPGAVTSSRSTTSCSRGPRRSSRRLVIEQLLDRATIIDPAVAAFQGGVCQGPRGGRGGRDPATSADRRRAIITATAAKPASSPLLEPQPTLDAIQDELSRSFSRRLLLWKVERDELAAFGGELDSAVQMPGWTNVWTMPIQNRVDMLATGVNTPIGIRVLGRNLDDVVRGSEEVARVVKPLPGAVDVVADPIRGKPYIEIRLDRARAARLGVSAGEVNDLIETALAGKVVTLDRRGPRAAPRRRPLRPGLARRRRVDPQPAR